MGLQLMVVLIILMLTRCLRIVGIQLYRLGDWNQAHPSKIGS